MKYNETKDLTKYFPSKEEYCGGPPLFTCGGTLYTDPTDAHVLVNARTGSGKTMGISTSTAISTLLAGQSLIVLDSKGDLLRATGKLAQKDHDVYVFDFTDPAHSPDTMNLLEEPYHLFKTGKISDVDTASEMIESLVSSIYPLDNDKSNDPFWNQASASLVQGIIQMLFELAEDPAAINMASVFEVFSTGLQTQGTSVRLKSLVDRSSSIVRMLTETYVNSPSDTRKSIHSVAARGLSIFSTSLGLRSITARSSFRLRDLNPEKPFAVYIVKPDWSHIADPVCAIILEQLICHLIRLATTQYAGKLPNRVMVICEELGSMAACLGDLPTLLAAGRSRNIRIMLVLQDAMTQLVNNYGEANASSILANIGLTYQFSTNNSKELQLLSQRIGTVTDRLGKSRPILTPSDIGALPPMTALVNISDRYRFVEQFQLYFDAFPEVEFGPPSKERGKPNIEIPLFDPQAYLMSKLLGGMQNG